MSWRHYLLLTLVGLVVVIIVAAFQSAPGYMDADYYYAGGLQLASGHGFTEPYLWNYLDTPSWITPPLQCLLDAVGLAARCSRCGSFRTCFLVRRPGWISWLWRLLFPH